MKGSSKNKANPENSTYHILDLQQLQYVYSYLIQALNHENSKRLLIVWLEYKRQNIVKTNINRQSLNELRQTLHKIGAKCCLIKD